VEDEDGVESTEKGAQKGAEPEAGLSPGKLPEGLRQEEKRRNQ
jgi:hypothetical protein